MKTDIAGAARAGLDALFVTGGIHRSLHGEAPASPADPVELQRLYDEHGMSPLAAISSPPVLKAVRRWRSFRRSISRISALGMRAAIRKTVENEDVIGFAELSGDHNPIHLSEHFARKTRFGGRIVHGLYTASLISGVIGMRLPGPGRGLYFADPELSWSGQDRRRGRRQRRGGRTDGEGPPRPAAMRMPRRRQARP